MDAMENSLQNIETHMRKIASDWTKASSTRRAQRIIEHQCELDGCNPGELEARLSSIRKRLSGQRRMAKTNHPRYDANLHISLKTELLRLERIASKPG